MKKVPQRAGLREPEPKLPPAAHAAIGCLRQAYRFMGIAGEIKFRDERTALSMLITDVSQKATKIGRSELARSA